MRRLIEPVIDLISDNKMAETWRNKYKHYYMLEHTIKNIFLYAIVQYEYEEDNNYLYKYKRTHRI